MISVIIPVFNKENYILNSIKSVLNQTYADFEIIVVDDGSTDKSFKLIDQLNNPKVRLLRQVNKGVSSARNLGISVSHSNYIALLDADDLWETTFLEEMSCLIRDFPEASLYGCSWAYLDKNGNKTSNNYGIKPGFRGYVDNYFSIEEYNTLFNSSSVILEKKAFYEVGAFDEKLWIGEDMDLWFRFGLMKKLAFLDKQLSYYLIDSNDRATYRPKDINHCLIGNLSKFRDFETTRQDFKRFLDIWRFHNIIDFFEGRRDELKGIKAILGEMDLNNFAFFWTFLRYTPEFLHKLFYKLRSYYLGSK